MDYELQMIERSQFSIIPQFGYFVSDIVSVGGQIGYRRDTYSNNFEVNPYDRVDYMRKDNTLNLGMFTRVHKPVTDNLYLFLQGNVDLGFGKVQYEETQNNDQNRFDFIAGIQPGLLYMVSEKLGIESTFGFLGYQSAKTSNTDSTEENNTLEDSRRFGVSFHPSSFSLGLQFYL